MSSFAVAMLLMFTVGTDASRVDKTVSVKTLMSALDGLVGLLLYDKPVPCRGPRDNPRLAQG